MSRSNKKGVVIALLLVLGIIVAVPLSRYGYIEYTKYKFNKKWTKEIALFERGIERDIPLAMYGLGFKYHTGRGVKKDHVKARELYKRAADLGEAIAQYNLGFMYHNGEGGPQDIEMAIFYYEKAAEQNFYLALMSLSEMYREGAGVEQDPEKAKLLKKRGLENFGKSLSYEYQYKQIIKYQLGEF